jgi:hypothetical protein
LDGQAKQLRSNNLETVPSLTVIAYIIASYELVTTNANLKDLGAHNKIRNLHIGNGKIARG